MPEIDLASTPLRELNAALHRLRPDTNERHWIVDHPAGRHAIAAGLNVPITVEINGPVGYYCAGMNKHATVLIHGSAGVGVAENMMSGFVHVAGDASQSAGATGRGGLLRIDGNASSRCGISMKGIDIVVKGSVGHMSAFMAQAGNLIVFGDAGDSLGDSIYEARLFVRGKVKSLGADCIEKPMRDEHKRAAACGARTGRISTARSTPANSGATARRASSTVSTSITPEPIDGLDAENRPAPLRHVRCVFAVGDPPRRRDRHLRYSRRRRQAEGTAFRRSSVSRRLDQPLSARRLSRALRYRCMARHPLRREADPHQRFPSPSPA